MRTLAIEEIKGLRVCLNMGWLLIFFPLFLPALTSAQSLRNYADRANILIGTAVRALPLSEPLYAATLADEFNLVEPEDALKWEVLHPQRNLFDFSEGDRIVAFAQLHGMKVRGHTLVWTHQNPLWLTHGTFQETELRSILQEHITQVLRHYRGRVFAWDVVNEAVDESGNLRNSLWYNQPGTGLAGQRTAYLEQAFRWAHEADPDALLFYNDGGGEAINAKSNAVYEMLRDFRKRNVPIHGIGLQMHSDLNSDVLSIAQNIRRFSELGLLVHITEADLGIPVDGNRKVINLATLDQQAAVYRAILTACLQAPNCSAFQTWGFTDRYSWINSSSHGAKGAALFFDPQYRRKPSYYAVSATLARGR